MLSRKVTAMATRTGKRLTIRITDHVHEKLQLAADIVGTTMSQFLVQSALEKAEKVIESESRIVLTRKESLRILELMENPPPMNEKLKKLMSGYNKN